MVNRSIIIISTKVDASIRSYQPDTEIHIFKSLLDCGNKLESEVIRADAVYITKDVVVTEDGAGLNNRLTYIKDHIQNNAYLSTDAFIYITEKDSPELKSLNYLIENESLSNWEVIEGNLTRAFITDVVNGTMRNEVFNTKRKAVYRKPRADYVRDKLVEQSSLDTEYVSDDEDLMSVPMEEIPEIHVAVKTDKLKRVFIASNAKDPEGFAFTFLAAQYYGLKGKTILLESDMDYHTLSEYATKSGVDAYIFDIEEMYNSIDISLQNIRKSEKNLIIITCINRMTFSYHTVLNILLHNLVHDADYLIVQCSLENIPKDTECVVVVPSTVAGCLNVGEIVDAQQSTGLLFVGVDLNYLPQIHISSGEVMSKILQDVTSTKGIICPVVTITNLKLNGTAYDLGSVLGKGV